MGTVSELLAELSTFPGREEQLRNIKRWSIRNPMFYRPHLFTHSKHVAWLVEEVIPVVKRVTNGNFDERRSIAIALVHDDAEILTGDHQAGNKDKMTSEQLAELDKQERLALVELASKFPKKIGGYGYEELLLDILDLKTPEAQVAKYLDRFDGFGEGYHEIYAGNEHFAETVLTQYGVTPVFDDLNVRLRKSMVKKFPLLSELQDSHVLFEFPTLPNLHEESKNGTPHTLESLHLSTGFLQYDIWKKVILNSGDSEETKNLYTQQEFL